MGILKIFLWLLLSIISTALYVYYTKNYETEYILIVGSISLLCVVFLALIVEAILKLKKPSYYEYNEDVFFDTKWNWNWNLKKDILNLTASCPTCTNPVYYRFDTLLHKTEIVCSNCNKQLANVNSSHRNFLVESVKKSIIRKLKKEDSSF